MIKANVICGFSGTLKSTIAKILFPNLFYIESSTKFFWWYNKAICGLNLDINPMHNLAVRLFLLQHLDKDEVVLERSIYDYTFFVDYFKDEDICDYMPNHMEPLEDAYRKVIDPTYYLIVNKAPKFIKNYVLGSDEMRSDVYTSVDQYYKVQDLYLNYITSHIKNFNQLILTDELALEIINNNYSNINFINDCQGI